VPLAPGHPRSLPRGKTVPAERPVELSQIDPAVWRLLAGRETFGPYTIGQLQRFAIEGRITPRSRIAQGEVEPFRPVSEIPRLAETLAGAFAERVRRRAEAANFLIITRAPLPAEAQLAAQIPECLAGLGKYMMLMHGTWLLRSAKPLASVRTALTGALPRNVQFVVMEAREARLSWLGLGDEMADAVRTVWNASLEPDPPR